MMTQGALRGKGPRAQDAGPRGRWPPPPPGRHTLGVQDPAARGPTPARPRASRTVVLGVLGGVASGKSAAARLLAGPAGVVLSADAAAHAALAEPEVVEAIRAAFGPGVIGADGAVDRPALAAVVFRDPEARRRLEGWIHPRVRATLRAALEAARVEGRPRVVLDVPLLLEHDAQHGLARACDHLVFIEVADAERERRAARSRGWQPGEVLRREAAQLPLDQKRRRADVVVPNDGTPEDLAAAVAAALAELGLA